MAKSHGPRFVALVNEARHRVPTCTVHDVKAWLDAGERMRLLDVREESEYAAGRLPGAIHLGKGVIERDVEALEPDLQAPLVLYCGGGYRSLLAGDNLRKMGYANVVSVDGGWSGWLEAGYPVER